MIVLASPVGGGRLVAMALQDVLYLRHTDTVREARAVAKEWAAGKFDLHPGHERRLVCSVNAPPPLRRYAGPEHLPKAPIKIRKGVKHGD